MSSRDTLTADDEGKPVIDDAGNTIGRVVDVESGRAYVDPDPSMTETLLAKLGRGSGDEDTYILDEADIETVTDDEIRLEPL